MSQGPSHPAIQAEVRRSVRAARVRLGLSAVVFLGLAWALVFPELVVSWTQALVSDHLPDILQVVD